MDRQLYLDIHEPSLWQKLKRYALVAGEEVVEKVLQLYYALDAPQTPKWAKTVIVGALAYFILPTDAIPDLVPGVGYTDDLGALVAALSTVHMHIDDDIRARARTKMQQWFGTDGLDT